MTEEWVRGLSGHQYVRHLACASGAALEMASSMVVSLGSSETVASVMRMRDATEAAFWSVVRVTFDQVEDAHLDHVTVVAGRRVETLALGQALDLLDHNGALVASVARDGLHRGLERLADDVDAQSSMGSEVSIESARSRSQNAHAPPPATMPSRRPHGVGLAGILDGALRSLELYLSSSANLDDRDTAGELGQTLLELLLVEVGGGVLNLVLDLGDALLDGVLGVGAANDGGVVLGRS